MRVIAGEFKRRQLKSLPGDQAALRPTSDRVRENVFNLLGLKVEGTRFLDLYAGTGAVGIEALSRGAARVTFVEKNAACSRVIQKNLDMLGVDKRSEIVTRDALSWLKTAGRGRTYGVVYIDPPYQTDLQVKALEILCSGKLLDDDAVVLVERRDPFELQSSGVLVNKDIRKYGKTTIEVWERKKTNASE